MENSAYIKLNNNMLPGISGLLDYSPATAAPLLMLAETLLRSESTLSSAEREMIAARVSYLNNCHFCHSSHAAAAVAHLGCDLSLMDDIKKGFRETELSPRIRALIHIAELVQKGGRNVTDEAVSKAKDLGATDREIHDVVLIAAAFCMYNRYVDGLNTWAPSENEDYREMGEMLAFEGYTRNS